MWGNFMNIFFDGTLEESSERQVRETTPGVIEMHIPADTRSAFPVISVQSPVSIQCCWQS